MRVVAPDHPLSGQALRARHVYRRFGRRWLVLELGDGGVVSVEVEDTDVLDAAPVVTVPGGSTTLSSAGARRLLGLLGLYIERIAPDAAAASGREVSGHGRVSCPPTRSSSPPSSRALFESDVQLAERLNGAQRRLRHANDQLWSGLHPDAIGLVYDDARRVAGDVDTSTPAAWITDVLGGGRGRREAEIGLLAALQQTHCTISRAFAEYQAACEERRQLAVDVGELSAQPIAALSPPGGMKRLLAAPTCTSSRRRGHDEEGSAGAVLGRF